MTKDSQHDGVHGKDILDAIENNKVELCDGHFEAVVPRFCQGSNCAWIPTTIQFTLVAD